MIPSAGKFPFAVFATSSCFRDTSRAFVLKKKQKQQHQQQNKLM